jgi:hypothetical protein
MRTDSMTTPQDRQRRAQPDDLADDDLGARREELKATFNT